MSRPAHPPSCRRREGPRRRHGLRFAALAPFLAAQSWAADPGLLDLPLDDLLQVQVISASKFAQPQSQAPSAVSVITAADIKAHGWRTITEALLSLPGTYAISDHAYSFVGARGFLVPGDYNTRFLLLVDGLRVNDNIYEQAFFGDEFLVDMDLVERIEYVPGPGSSIYGANAMFGVINVITRPAAALAGWRAAARGASDGEKHGRVSWGWDDGQGRSLLFSAGSSHWAGRDRRYAEGTAHDLDDKRTDQLFWRASGGGWTFEGIWRDRAVHPSSALYGVLFDDHRLRLADRSLIAALGKETEIAPGVASLVRIQAGEMHYRAEYPYDDGSGGSYLNVDRTVGRWWNGELRLNAALGERHRLVAGVEWQADIDARQRNFDRPLQPTSAGIDVDKRQRRWGVYIQDEWRVADTLLLNLGVRHDRFSLPQHSTTPRLAAIWQPRPATTVKILSGRAFRAANAYERDYANGIGYLANPSLRPETIRTHELVWEERLGSRTQLSASLFRYRLDNLIAQVVDASGAFIYRNLEPITARGAEVAIDHRFAGGTRLRGSLAVQRVTEEDGSRFVNSPSRVAKFQAEAPLGNSRWTLGWETQVVGPRQWEWGGSRQSVGTHVVSHAALAGRGVLPGLDVSVSVRDVFNRRLSDPAAQETGVPRVPQNGRTLVLQADYAF